MRQVLGAGLVGLGNVQMLRTVCSKCSSNKLSRKGLVQALAELPQTIARTVGAAVIVAIDPASRAKPTLVDTKGLGKPPPLKNTESDSTWAVEREAGMLATVSAEFLMPLETLQVVADQLYTVLISLV